MDIKNIILSQTAPVKKDCIWLKPSSDNIVDVYVYNNGSWQSTVRAVDLSDYITTSKLSDVLSGYVTTETLSNYQTSTDNSLNTDSKQIAGAINEILPKATGVGKVDPNSNGTGEVFNMYEEGLDANVASGRYSHAEGFRTNAAGNYSHAESWATTAANDFSHAEGYKTTASGEASHAEGFMTTVSGNYSHTEGRDTTASGEASHAEGQKTSASGGNSHTEGSNTNASGNSSHAEGKNTQAFSTGEHAEGTYNKSYDSTDSSVRVIHSIGISSSANNRKNAHEIKFNGDHYVYGVGNFDGTNSADAQTLQEVINSKQATITAGTGLEFEGNTLNVTLDTTVFKVVSALPDAPAQGDENKIHLVPAESTGVNNAYTEYVWVNSAWEILGEYTSEVDLTPYLKTVDAANTYLSKTDASSTYLSKTDASSTYLNKTDATSTYVPKDGTGATGKWGIDISGRATYLYSNSIAENTDLNTIQQPGLYYCGSNASAATISNSPTDYAFSLLVEHHAGTKQTITEYLRDTPKMWFRNFYSDTWGSWYQIHYGPQDGNIITVPTLTQAYTIPGNSSDMELTYIITIGETAYSITGASGIKWAGGILPQVSPNTTIVVSVLNNLATWQTFV